MNNSDTEWDFNAPIADWPFGKDITTAQDYVYIHHGYNIMVGHNVCCWFRDQSNDCWHKAWASGCIREKLPDTAVMEADFEAASKDMNKEEKSSLAQQWIAELRKDRPRMIGSLECPPLVETSQKISRQEFDEVLDSIFGTHDTGLRVTTYGGSYTIVLAKSGEQTMRLSSGDGTLGPYEEVADHLLQQAGLNAIPDRIYDPVTGTLVTA